MQAGINAQRDSDDASRWASLLSWLKDTHGMSVDVDGLLVQCKDVPGAGRGLFASRACSPSTPLFTVPANALINTRTLAAIYPPRTYKRIQNLTAVQQISLHLLLHRPDGDQDSLDSSHGPYISTLPRDFVSHPLTWLVKHVDVGQDVPEIDLLKSLPPSVSLALTNLHTRFLNDWTVVHSRLNRHPVLYDLSSRSDLCAARLRFPDEVLLLDFLWAWLNVNTRCIHYRIRQPASDPDNLTLCPILDFANHSESHSHIMPVFTSEDMGGTPRRAYMGDYSFVSCSGSNIVQDQELFLRYGERPNRTLFVEYAFVNRFPVDAISKGDFRGDMDVQDILEHMLLIHPLGSQMKRILEDEGYWGDWTLHSSPRPAHPSYRVVVALRLFHAVDELPPGATSVPCEIIQTWRNVVNGYADAISEGNDKMWRDSLVRICEDIVARAQKHVPGKLVDGEDWHKWAQENIRLLWQEEMETALAVAHSVRTGENF
ncbi:SET domain-containing protein [Amylocystis lapponica]|nr:SET domain-containing protein [Amylocystis lapponica]